MPRLIWQRFYLNLHSRNQLTFIGSLKFYSNRTKTPAANESISPTPNPSDLQNDMIGPPNQVSNLRPVVCHVPKNESHLERQFRLERERVQRWNEEFWVKHNSAFMKESKEFRQKKLDLSPDNDKKSLSAEEMSEFYKAFLDKNWRTHVSYNFEWYRKNFNLIYLALKVQFSKVGLGRR